MDPETTQREDSKLKQKTKRNKKIRRQAVPRATKGDTTPTFKKFHETPNETKKQVIQKESKTPITKRRTETSA